MSCFPFFLFLSCFGAAPPCENRTTTAGGFRVCPDCCPVRAGHNFPTKNKNKNNKSRKITKQAHHFIGYCVDESVSRVLAHNQTMYTHTRALAGVHRRANIVCPSQLAEKRKKKRERKRDIGRIHCWLAKRRRFRD